MIFFLYRDIIKRKSSIAYNINLMD